MEFVKVKYWRRRSVLIDGKPSGALTNETFRTNEGRHTFSLSPPPNYSPLQRTRTVRNTSRLRPLELEFKHESQA